MVLLKVRHTDVPAAGEDGAAAAVFDLDLTLGLTAGGNAHFGTKPAHDAGQ